MGLEPPHLFYPIPYIPILFGWDWNPQSDSREGSGFSGSIKLQPLLLPAIGFLCKKYPKRCRVAHLLATWSFEMDLGYVHRPKNGGSCKDHVRGGESENGGRAQVGGSETWTYGMLEEYPLI